MTLINLLNYMDRWIIAAVAPRLQETLSLSNAEIGTVMSAFMLGYFITSPFFGWASDRFSRKYLVAAGVLVWCFATIGSGWARTFWSLIAMRAIVGIGEASYAAASPTILTDLYPTQKRNTVVALFQAAVPIGAALGFLAGGYLEKNYGWQWAFYIAGIPGFLAVLGLLFVREPKRGAAEENQDFKKDLSESIFKWVFREFRENATYRNAVLGYTAWSFTVGGFASWCPKYAVAVRGLELSQGNYIIGLITVVAGVGGTLLGGWIGTLLQRRFGRPGPVFLMIISVLAAIPFAVYAFITPSTTGFFVCLGITEFILFMGHAPVNVVIVESVPVVVRATALAFTTFTIHILGDLISPPLVGVLADHWDLGKAIMVLPLMLFGCVRFWMLTLRDMKSRLRVQSPL